jgi:carboxymethylenebutenolidase
VCLGGQWLFHSAVSHSLLFPTFPLSFPLSLLLKMPSVTYSASGNKGYYAAGSKADTTVGLVVVQEWWGLNKQMEGMTERFAAQGMHALCPDLFHGRVAATEDEAKHLMGALDWPKAVEELQEAVAFLKGKGAAKVCVVGFCMGGALAAAAAVKFPGEIAGALPFYGTPPAVFADLAKTGVPVQGHFGEKDLDHPGFSDPAAADAYEKQLAEAVVEHTIFRYPGVGHAFMNEARPEAFNKEASDLAFTRAVKFILSV